MKLKAVYSNRRLFFYLRDWARMAIRKQNRTIWALAAAVFVVLVSVMVSDGRFMDALISNSQVTGDLPSAIEQFGDRFVDPTEESPSDSRGQFRDILNQMSTCFELPSTETELNVMPTAAGLVQKLENDFGPISHQKDRWMQWHLRTREGKERRLRLEIIESDDGQMRKELTYYGVDRQGQPTSLELSPEMATNPNDEVISQMLKEGEVFLKESSAIAHFFSHEKVEYTDRNGELVEFEVFKGDRRFGCRDAQVPATCLCE